MLVDIPDHYLPNVGGALVERAADIVNRLDMVPAYLHQFAALWADGVHYGGDDRDFWTAVYEAGGRLSTLKREGVLGGDR